MLSARWLSLGSRIRSFERKWASSPPLLVPRSVPGGNAPLVRGYRLTTPALLSGAEQTSAHAARRMVAQPRCRAGRADGPTSGLVVQCLA